MHNIDTCISIPLPQSLRDLTTTVTQVGCLLSGCLNGVKQEIWTLCTSLGQCASEWDSASQNNLDSRVSMFASPDGITLTICNVSGPK